MLGGELRIDGPRRGTTCAFRRRCPGGRAASARRPARHRTGMPFRNAIPASRSRSSGSPLASGFTFTPAFSFASRQPPLWPQPCGSATAPGSHLVGHLHRQVDRRPTSTRSAPRRRPRARARPRRRDARARVRAAAAHQQRRVVHPRVVGAQLAQPDQPQRERRVVAARRRPGASSPRSRRARAEPLRRWRIFASTPVRTWSASTIPCGCSRAASPG